MKKILLLTLMAAVMSFNVLADDGGQCGPNSTWYYSSVDSTMTISGFGAMYDWEDIDWVPWAHYGDSTINIIVENGITTIGKASFFEFDAKYLTLPETVTDINGVAFAFCDFETLTLPNSVTFIGARAFANCNYLKSVTLPASLTYIELQGEYGPGHYYSWCCAFRECDSLETIIIDNDNPIYDSRDNCNAIIETATNKLLFGCKGTVIPLSVTEIAAIAFCDSTIQSIEIPESVTKIGIGAFDGSSQLISVELPNSLTEMGNGVFVDCEQLSSVAIGNSLTNIPYKTFNECKRLASVTFNNIIDTIGSYAFYKCESLSSLAFPQSLVAIYNHAFCFCEGLTTIELDKSLEFIGDCAFAKCSSLSGIYCLAEIPPVCGTKVFYEVDQSITLYVPYGCSEAYRNADTWKDFINIIELPEHYGVNDNQDVSISVYPNPTTSSVKIEGENINSVTIFDLSGRMIKTQNNSLETVDIRGFTPGVYVMKIALKNGDVSEKKIVKE